jgi:acetyl esterase/lipase
MDTWSVIPPAPGTMDMPMMDVTNIRRKFLDIPYASQSPSQKLDIYLPSEGDGPFPTVIFVHGGAFIQGDKRDAQLLQALGALHRGYAVASVEYRLGPEAKYPAGLFDVKAAIRFLRANAAAYELDGSRFGLTGDSAGGYYVNMAAATQDNPAFEDFSMGNATYSSKVQAVVSRFGLCDFLVQSEAAHEDPPKADPNADEIDTILFGSPARAIPGLMLFSNVLRYITPDFPPIYLQHGTDDGTVTVRHSYLMAEKVRAVCGPDRVEIDIYDGYNHGGIDLRWDEADVNEKIVDFFDRKLKA